MGATGEQRESPLLLNVVVMLYSLLLWLVLPRRATHRSADVPGVDALSAAWRSVRREFDQVAERATLPPIQDLDPGLVYATRDEDWRLYLLRAYGRDVPTTSAAFPETMALLDGIDGVTNAMFSVFEPGKAIRWHVGVLKGITRCHLGVVIPDGDCGIQVCRTTFRWHEGDVFLFDDSYPHRAHNHTAARRVVLMIDIVQPMPWAWLDRVHTRVIDRIGTSRRFRNTRIRAEAFAQADAGEPAAASVGLHDR